MGTGDDSDTVIYTDNDTDKNCDTDTDKVIIVVSYLHYYSTLWINRAVAADPWWGA